MSKENRPAETAAPSGTITIALPDYNMFSPEEQEKAVKLTELFFMAMQVNGMEERDRKKTGSLPTVFAGIRGHVAKFSMSIYPDGWSEDDVQEEIVVYYDDDPDSFDDQFECMRLRLCDILKGMSHDRV